MTPSTLYLTRNGLLEPLGQSQVFAYLRGLSTNYKIILITYEKDDDWRDASRMSDMREACGRLGIRWLPQRFRGSPKYFAPAFSMMRMTWLALRETKKQHVRLIHARSYVPAAVAMIVGRMTGVPFVFDMRALWPEELIIAGRLTRGSLLHWAIVAAEEACLRRAGAVVSLTHAAVGHLKTTYPEAMRTQTVAVIPTCADIDRFMPAVRPPDRRIIGCLGTVLSGWFRLDWLASFLAVAAERDPDMIFELTTRDDPVRVRASVDPEGRLGERLRIAACAPEDVHRVLQGQIASVMFFTDGLGKLGSSPTRMGEVLGTGLPVVANAGVGDVARIITSHRVGVLVEGPGPDQMAAALDKLDSLMADPELTDRCRAAAGKVFSLSEGVGAYRALYEGILNSQIPRDAFHGK